ncbi:MAG: RNA methyltransferase [Clostridia bacterium]|nr:RNA methyltransferase [Clostridia bacterium]
MDIITSRANPKIKYACSLKKSSGTSEYVLAEGLRLCEDAAQNGVEIEMCLLSEKMLASGQAGRIVAHSAHTYIIEEHICEKLTDTKHPQGIFCVCKKPSLTAQVDYSGKYLFLEQVRDPGNFGTIIRTAEAFGLSGVMASGCCEVFSQKVMRASMGAVFRFPIIQTDQPLPFLADCKEHGMDVFCSVVSGEAADVGVLAHRQGIITAVGNEANGLSAQLIACGSAVTIRMRGRAESLNASQAATVMMYEMSK